MSSRPSRARVDVPKRYTAQPGPSGLSVSRRVHIRNELYGQCNERTAGVRISRTVLRPALLVGRACIPRGKRDHNSPQQQRTCQDVICCYGDWWRVATSSLASLEYVISEVWKSAVRNSYKYRRKKSTYGQQKWRHVNSTVVRHN